MITWHIVTSDVYHAGTPIEGHMYFLSDTKEIYRGTQNFSESVVLVTEFPSTSIARNRLYMNSTTLEGRIYDGSAWTTVIQPAADTVAEDGVTPVTGKAVAAYVAAEMAKVSTSEEVVHSLSWDSAEHLLTVTKGDESTEEIVFDGLGVSLSYSSATGELQLLDGSGNAIGDPINLDLERFVKTAVYNAETQCIELTFNDNEEPISIDVAALVNTYEAAETSSIAMVLGDDAKTFSASIKISTAEGNLIELKDDGIYVAPINVDLSGKMDKDEDATEGNIAVFDAEGNAIDSGKSFDDITVDHTVFQGASIDEAVNGATPKDGDYCIVKTPIGANEGKQQYTAYVYDNNAWVAMDGNYDASNIYFSKDLQSAYALGNFSLKNGLATIPTTGRNLEQLFEDIYMVTKSPSVTQPKVTVTMNQAGAYEVGTSVTPSYSASLSAGTYSYGSVENPSSTSAGITAKTWAVTDTDGHSATTNTGSFDAFTVSDDLTASAPYTISATATYDAGLTPANNKGEAVESKKIAAGSKSATSSGITGYRRGFYGTYANKDAAITADNSAFVRDLANKTSATPVKGEEWTLNIPVGAMRLVFAYPASLGDVAKVIDVEGMFADVTTSFTKYTVNVEGANGYAAIPYNVYVADKGEAFAATRTYTITL